MRGAIIKNVREIKTLIPVAQIPGLNQPAISAYQQE